MAQGIRIKMMDKEIELDSPDNMLAKHSVKTALFLPDNAFVRISYELDSRQKFCRTNETGTTFLLPDGWRDLQFFVDSDRTPSPMDSKQPDRIPKKVMMDWEDRVFMVFGRNDSQGSGVLISDQKILTAAHLSFKLGESYLVKGTKDRCFRARCQFISKSCDFALLTSSDVPALSTPTDQISRGSVYFILGYPNGTTTALPSITQGVIEGMLDDHIHLVGTPGSRRGYSGAPVFNDFGCLAGILLGSTSSVHIDTTIRECLALSAEQKYSRILGITSINLHYNEGRSDNES